VLLHGVGLVDSRLSRLYKPGWFIQQRICHGIRRLVAQTDEIHPALQVAHVEAHLVEPIDDVVLHCPAVHVEAPHLGAVLKFGIEVEHVVGRVGVEAEFGQS